MIPNDTLTLDLPMTPEREGRGGDSCLASGSAFRCIVADPPWDLKVGSKRTRDSARCVVKRGKWGDPRQNNSAIKEIQYPTMSVEQICALKVPAADDAHCYIWTINRYIEQTYAVARAWGFEPAIMLYWLKQPMGLGLGGAFCGCVEPILFCRRGSLPVKSRCDRNWWGWPRGLALSEARRISNGRGVRVARTILGIVCPAETARLDDHRQWN